MDILEAVARRHSVRSYTDKKIEGEVLTELLEEIESCNADSGLNIQLVTNEPQAFKTKLAKEFCIPCISLKEVFDEKISESNQKYYVRDGVHPTAMGHGIIAKEWERVFKKYENL